MESLNHAIERHGPDRQLPYRRPRSIWPLHGSSGMVQTHGDWLLTFPLPLSSLFPGHELMTLI
jgi:hypothetical protein